MKDYYGVLKFIQGGLPEPGVEKQPRSKRLSSVDQGGQVDSFDLKLEKMSDFLSTPFLTYADSLGIDDSTAGEESRENGYDLVRRAIAENFRNKVDQLIASDKLVAINYLDKLAQDEEMPEIFKMFSLDEMKRIEQLIKGKDAWFIEKELWTDDVVEYATTIYLEQSDNIDHDFTTYRSFYYELIVEALAKCGNEAVPVLLKLLKKIDQAELKTLATSEIYVHHEGTTPLVIDDESFATENRLVERAGDDIFFDLQSFHSEPIIITEFEKVKEVLFKKLREMDIDDETVYYMAERLKNFVRSDLVNNRSDNFFEMLAILNKHPELAAKELLQQLNENEDRLERALLSRFLFHIELGKLGVADGVVEYLDKKYTLQGKERSEVEMAHRLTGDGKIGLFDSDEVLIGYIELGDLVGGEEMRQAQILDLSRDLLFADPETPDIIRQQFKNDYLKFFNDLFFKETGIYFNNLSLREQLWFFQYMKKASPADKKRAQEVVKKYGEAALTCFIATEQDGQAGESIFTIAESGIAEKTKENIFRVYGSIVAVLDEVRGSALEFFKDKELSVDYNKITANIAKRAYEILQNLSIAIEKTGNGKVVEEMLKNISRDVILFATVFKNIIQQNPELNFEDIVGADIQSIDSSLLAPEDKASMREMFYANRLEVGQEFADTRVATEFDPVINEAGHKFCFYKQNKEIMSFVRFDELPNGNLYAGFLNARTDIRGLSIGSAFFKTVLNREAKGRTVEIKVRTENQSALNLYKDKLEFVIEGEPYIDKITKKEYVKMVRQPGIEVGDLALAA